MDIMGFTLFRVPRGCSPTQRSVASLQILSILIVLTFGILLPHRADGYVLEGVTWLSASVVTFQMGLGSAGRNLFDGNTSWYTAASLALNAWDYSPARYQSKSNGMNDLASTQARLN